MSETNKNHSDNSRGISLNFLDAQNIHEAVFPYISVFQDHPWHEEFECSCGQGPFFMGCKKHNDSCSELKSEKIFLVNSEDQQCHSCGRLLNDSLQPIYSTEGVKADLLKSTNNQGFIGIGAKKFGLIVGISLGYTLPQDHPPKTGSTWYNEAKEIIETLGYDPNKVFYHNESFTLPGFEGRGIATRSLLMMLKTARQQGMNNVAYRTINPAMNRCYEKVYSLDAGSLMPSFNDPNPNKRQGWYVLDLNRLGD